MDNRLVIAGTVAKRPETRVTPAGIPITRFSLRHESQQTEAGMNRKASCFIAVVASGKELQAEVQRIGEGSTVRVTGFLSRAEHSNEYRLVLHAQSVEPIAI